MHLKHKPSPENLETSGNIWKPQPALLCQPASLSPGQFYAAAGTSLRMAQGRTGNSADGTHVLQNLSMQVQSIGNNEVCEKRSCMSIYQTIGNAQTGCLSPALDTFQPNVANAVSAGLAIFWYPDSVGQWRQAHQYPRDDSGQD